MDREPQDKMGNQYFMNKVDLADAVKTHSTQEEDPAIKVNKKGWANAEYYKENTSIRGITNDNKPLVKTMNQDLVNSQLDNYQNTNFTEDQFLSQIWKESGGDKSVVSPRGAMGVAQFLPDTFKWAKEKGWIPETAKITDEAASSLAQKRYMDYLYTDINNVASATDKTERQARAFSAYNMGPTNFNKMWAKLTKEEKEGGWRNWYTKGGDENEKYVLWMMDKNKYKAENSTPYKHPKGYITSIWNNVNYGYKSWKETNPKYRYK